MSIGVYSLSAYISGTEDAQDDYAFSISSFGLSKRNAETSYYSVSAPLTGDMMDEMLARPNGIIHILRDGVEWETYNIGHPIRYDKGPRSSSVSINGTRQDTNAAPASHTIDTHMATSEAINSSGLLTLGIVPGYLDPMPGDTVTWNGADYTLTLINYQSGSGWQTLNYTCTPVV